MKKSLANYIIFVISSFMFISFSIIEFFHYQTLKKSIIKSEKARLETILETITPIVAVNLSFDLVDSISEPILQLHSKNSSIIYTKIYNTKNNLIFQHRNRPDIINKAVIFKKVPIVNNIGFGDEVLGSIEMSYYNNDYEKLLQQANQQAAILILIILILIILLSMILKNILKPLETLTEKLKTYKPNESFSLETYSKFEDIEVIKNTINSLLESVYRYTRDMHNLNNTLEDKVQLQTIKLVELNRGLEKRVQEAIFEIREKDKIMVEQAKLAQMGEMISMIAHQWKQPLAIISAITSNIRVQKEMGILTHEETYSFMLDIENKLKYLSNTVDDFRTFFKPNKEKEGIYIHDTIQQAKNLLKQELFDIEIEEDYQYKLLIYSYKNELLQVFLNMIKNAIDIFKEREIEVGRIQIKTYSDDYFVITEISDNAGGIKEELLSKIFEPYFTTKDEKNGTGLGMYMCKIIIDEHCEGKLEVKNTPIGAQFTIKIPKEDITKFTMNK